ncbi:MAG: ATP-dependent zinc metalloprotease FtsH [Prevotellaceae bacterium]|jgi:cell division protease FtsH|nr:ATP-dependent zinc metalloprotease FtsH [Prevotellaceae bacterium]
MENNKNNAQKPIKKQPQHNPLNNNNKPQKFNVSWVYIIIAVVLVGMYYKYQDTQQTVTKKEIAYSDFGKYLKGDYIKSIDVFLAPSSSISTLEAVVKTDSIKKVFGDSAKINPALGALLTVKIPSIAEFQSLLKEAKTDNNIDIVVNYKEQKTLLLDFLLSILPFVLFIGLILLINRKALGSMGGAGGVFGVGKSRAQVFDKGNDKDKITFKDVAGLAGAKQEVQEIVEFLKKPEKFTELGGKIPKGALLVGPPGTGKTLLAKAVAGEADVPFFSLSGSDFVEMFVGVGASRVRDLFRQAKEKAPCIIFIDEIDAVGRARGKNVNFGGNDERESTLNQLLTEMDGFGTNSGIIILAATNRADILDKALLRAGRFDRQIHVDLPDIQERKEIFLVHLRPLKIDTALDIDFLAKQTPGFSGADIANVCNEAALIAARNNKKHVDKQDFLDAVDRIIGGLEKKNKITTVSEKKSIAYHEAGHATISWKTQYANPLVKVTIVPRGDALGAAWYLPEERQLTNIAHLKDELCSLLGGRAAEEVFLGEISTGALNDLERVTKRAYAMVAYFGMSKKLENMSYYDSSGQSDYGFTKPYSEQTAELIDQEAKKIVAEQYERAKEILRENTEGHNELATLLIDKEVIFADDMEKIFGKRQWVSRNDELIAINGNTENEKTINEKTTEV